MTYTLSGQFALYAGQTQSRGNRRLYCMEPRLRLLFRFFQESPEAIQLFDGDGDFESAEFLAHARRLITSLQTEIQQLDDSDHHHHHHHGDAPLSNTTPDIQQVCNFV